MRPAQLLTYANAVLGLPQRWVQTNPVRLVALGYANYILIGWALLCLPISQATSGASILDHLFTAASAVSTTGLVTVATSDSYSWFGEFVILLLMQFGGLGYMTITSFIVLVVSRDLSFKRKRVSESAVALPQPYMLRSYLRMIVAFTLIIETIGAAALYPSFVSHGAPNPAGQAVFHSVSAFCTAGFGLFSNSFEDYRDDAWLNFVVTVLSYLGALGFIVLHDAWQSLTNRKRFMTLTTKIILWATMWIGLIGTVLFFVDEPLVQEMPMWRRAMTSVFQVMTASTTVGFNTIPIGALSASSLFLLTVIMIIGASPSGTGGGLKTTTITALWAEMVSVIRRREQSTFARRGIPEHRVRAAVASATFYLLTLSAGIYALALVESSPWPDQVFECASALGTVGLSRGITGSLTTVGKCIIIALMYVGRVGPIVMGMSLVKAKTVRWRYLEEDVVVG